MLHAITNNQPAGTYIMLLSDGAESSAPYIADVLPSILQDGIILNSIAYGYESFYLETIESNKRKVLL